MIVYGDLLWNIILLAHLSPYISAEKEHRCERVLCVICELNTWDGEACGKYVSSEELHIISLTSSDLWNNKIRK